MEVCKTRSEILRIGSKGVQLQIVTPARYQWIQIDQANQLCYAKDTENIISHRDEEVGLSKLVKLWKLPLVSLWLLTTIHLLKEHNGNTNTKFFPAV